MRNMDILGRLIIGTVNLFFACTWACAQPAYTVLNANHYNLTVKHARAKVQTLLKELSSQRQLSLDEQVAFITEKLADIPYFYAGAMGEGDWQPNALSYQPGAVQINQHPVYRMDGMDCQTLTQMVMALLLSNDLDQFDTHMVKIAYGAFQKRWGNRVDFYNRNHFIEGDFNRVNQERGWLKDVTSHGPLAPYASTTSILLSRYQWFLWQQQHAVQVLDAKTGQAMVKRMKTQLADLTEPRARLEKITLTYLPKTGLALPNPDGTYRANTTLLARIPTPALAEIVYDTKQWRVQRKNIKDVIGTELAIAHLGILYRQTFHQGELIYHRIRCAWHAKQHTTLCQVKPIFCDHPQCPTLMFAHATYAYPKQYYWYQQKGRYVCTSHLPSQVLRYSSCNRVERLPLFDYLTDFQYGSYWYMNWPAIAGIHIEKLSLYSD